MKRLHLVWGWIFGGSFVLTGLWMQIHFPGAYQGDAGMRMAYRSAHVYILLAALMNSLLGVYLEAPRTPRRRVMQRVGSALVLLAPVVFTVAFFVEPAPATMARPLSATGLFCAIYGTLLHLAAQRGARDANAVASEHAEPLPAALPVGPAPADAAPWPRAAFARRLGLVAVGIAAVALVAALRGGSEAPALVPEERVAAVVRRVTIATSAEERAAVARAARAGRRFADCGEGKVIDVETNLMWAARDNRNGTAWNEARQYAAGFRAGGYSDWRLPTIAELASLAAGMSAAGDTPPAEAPTVDSVTPVGYGVPWSAETRGAEAARVHLSSGAVGWVPQSSTSHNRALPVRGVPLREDAGAVGAATARLFAGAP